VPPETSILSANDGSGTALTDGATTLAAAGVLRFDGADNGREPPPNGTTADAIRLDEAQLAVIETVKPTSNLVNRVANHCAFENRQFSR
jgi:hypothetical protein